MNNSLYIIAALLLILWAIVTFGFGSYRYIDILLPLAGIIILLRVFYKKRTIKK